ncbi:MAG: glucose-6-phosphate isomerase [Gammaproteobacteria bacterium]|nr:glucose-6-phosphate isomerase [Gammaproteobacteria bacterium]
MNHSLTQLPSYQALASHFEEIKLHSMREMFAQDESRFSKFSVQLNGLLFDYSKNRINVATIDKLVALFDECDVPIWRDKMFSGEKINSTEDRAVQHTALRNLGDKNSALTKKQLAVLLLIEAFVEKVDRSNITDVVNIGIGGSHLGPMLVCDALREISKPNLNVHFVANVDAEEINRVLSKINPVNTLFIVTSKSFTTQETLTNAKTARNWLLKSENLKSENHFVAVTADVEKARKFGIAEDNIFPMWDEIGGRFSLWSAVGLSIALSLGVDAFKRLLSGAHAMDEHFINAPTDKNIPVLMALLDIWNQHFLAAATHAILPYDVRLAYFPAYLQQLVMESNGKSVDREGNALNVPSSPVVFGDVGTNAQHSFFQLLHQGTHNVSCDFIGVAKAAHDNQEQHDMLLANMIGQTQALMKGQTLQEVGDVDYAEHKVFLGNRISNTIFLNELNPYSLGMLVAMYEHKTFVQGVLLNINSFDQMGVELGKRLANDLLENIKDQSPGADLDSSTNGMIDFYKQNK